MTWFKIDDSFYDHPKVIDISLEAVGLWTLSGAYSARHLTDGVMTTRTALRLGGTEELVAELVAAGLWTVEEDEGKTEYLFNDWNDYQPTRDAVLSEREAGRQRAAASRARRSGQRSPEGSPAGSPELKGNVRQDGQVPNAEAATHVHPTRPDPTRPDLVEEPSVPAAPAFNVVKSFDEVYAAWPKKRDRKEALDRYRLALKKFKGREQDLVKAILDHAAAHEKHTETRFVRALGVWLNKESWTNPLPGTPEAGEVATGSPAGPPKRDPDAWMNAKRVDPSQRGNR